MWTKIFSNVFMRICRFLSGRGHGGRRKHIFLRAYNSPRTPSRIWVCAIVCAACRCSHVSHCVNTVAHLPRAHAHPLDSSFCATHPLCAGKLSLTMLSESLCVLLEENQDLLQRFYADLSISLRARPWRAAKAHFPTRLKFTPHSLAHLGVCNRLRGVSMQSCLPLREHRRSFATRPLRTPFG